MLPERRKVARLEDSRQSWKHKAIERAIEIRALKMRINELEKSRASWKSKCAEAQLHIKKLQAGNERVVNELTPSFKFFFVSLFSLCASIARFPFVLALVLLRFFAGLCLVLLIFCIVRLIKQPLHVGRSRSVFSNCKQRRNRTLAGLLSQTSPFPSDKSASCVSLEHNKMPSLKAIR